MSTFTLAISCLTTFNLPWFMDLIFPVPMRYCSLQHWGLLLPPDIFFLELFVQVPPVAYWTLTNLKGSSFSVISFCLFILFMGFLRQECWSGLPFPSPVDHVLTELSTMTGLSWVALHSMAHSFIELDKAAVCVINFVSFLWLWFSVCLPSDGEG